MKKALFCLVAGLAGVIAQGEPFRNEPVMPMPITRVALFKNGLAAVIRQQMHPAPPGPPWLFTEEINPLHGTLWISPSAGLTVERVIRKVHRPNDNPFSEIGTTFQGKEITLRLQSNGTTPGETIRGTVVKQNGAFLTLRQSDGTLISFPATQVAVVTSGDIPATVEREQSVWRFSSRNRSAELVTLSYLTRGLFWSPSYRIALGPEGKMQLDQNAVIYNELNDLDGVETDLISGYPNIRCAEVLSPMAAGFNLNQFFSQLGNTQPQNWRARGMMFNQIAAPALMECDVGMAALSPLAASGSSEDIQLTNIGKITLKKGNSLYLPLASADTDYERIVEWTVQDQRDPWGYYRNQNQEAEKDELWDAVRFRNPLPGAMTSGPIEIVDGDKILGQAESSWVNPGQSTTVKITKALTVTGTNVEYELPITDSPNADQRRRVWIAGYNYRNPDVMGELTLKNYRKAPAKLLIRLQFSGKFLSADAEPVVSHLERGVYSVNPRIELKWEIELKPGEERKLNYRYSVFIRE